jgi:hypothetical protein
MCVRLTEQHINTKQNCSDFGLLLRKAFPRLFLSYDAHNSEDKSCLFLFKPEHISLYILKIQSKYIYPKCPNLLAISVLLPCYAMPCPQRVTHYEYVFLYGWLLSFVTEEVHSNDGICMFILYRCSTWISAQAGALSHDQAKTCTGCVLELRPHSLKNILMCIYQKGKHESSFNHWESKKIRYWTYSEHAKNKK